MKNENLKRTYELEEAESSVAYITNIILNPTRYHPRKMSLEEVKLNSKFDAYDPIFGSAKQQARTNLHNKYDMGQIDAQGNFRIKPNALNFQFSPQFRTPLNKDFDALSTNLSYTLKDISRIHFNLNVFKKFEFPKEFDGHYIDAIMNKAPKRSLDHYLFDKQKGRERSATLNLTHNGIYK
jgi:hypothetical protein